MKTETNDFKSRQLYFLIFLVSLGIPVFHYLLLNNALENTRNIIGFMPIFFLAHRWLGELSGTASAIAFILYLLSWKYDRLNSPTVFTYVLTVFYGFAVFYGANSAFVLALVLIR